MSAVGAPAHARVTWREFGSTAVLCTTHADALDPAREAVERVTAAVDRACNRFRANSELNLVCAMAGTAVRVSPLLFEALSLALDAAGATGGAVDPTVGGSLVAAGYDRDFDAIRPAARPAVWRPAGGWAGVELDAGRQTVLVPRGTQLDLGATAKALAVDRCAQAAASAGSCGVLFGIGGDLAVHGPVPADGWLVHVTDDHRSAPGAPGQPVSLHTGGLATSSTTVRRWRRGQAQVHHILDPATGMPAPEIWRTVSVAAHNCVQANVASTAAIVLGADAPAWLRRAGVAARLCALDGSVERVGGWPEDGDTECGS